MELPERVRDVITEHERWAFGTVRSSPHDDQFTEDLAAAIEAEIEHRIGTMGAKELPGTRSE